jgi:hypothetical protein
LAELSDYGRTLETVEEDASGIEQNMDETPMKDIHARTTKSSCYNAHV